MAVVGAIIDPRLCLNLLEAAALDFVKAGYDALLSDRKGRQELPKNGSGSKSWQRNLDCAVINMVHQIRELTQQPLWKKQNPGKAPLPPYDSVRGAFWEGGPLYDDARIEQKSHVQICVRNIQCIKGYFRPIED